MFKTFTSKLLKATLLSVFAMGAATMSAQTENLYLCDVATEAELAQDIFGVPMLIDNVAPYKYVARYYNTKAGNQIYFLTDKTSFKGAYGEMYGDLGLANIGDEDLNPIVLPEAGKYYEISLDLDEMTWAVSDYEVADYMDPVIWEQGSYNHNVWFSYVDDGTDSWTPNDDAWLREFYFGYTCTEYLINDNNEYVDVAGNVVKYDKEEGIDERVLVTTKNPIGEDVSAEQLRWVYPFKVDENNPHLYYWETPKHFVAGQKLNFIIHNWHEAGWWNAVTWRVDDENECDKFYYYGNVVKQAYLNWYFGDNAPKWNEWRDSEDVRRAALYGGGGDNWCKPTVQTTGNYVLYFDTHLGRAKLVPSAGGTTGIENVVADSKRVTVDVNGRNFKVNGDVSYVRLASVNGMAHSLRALGGNTFTTDAPKGIYLLYYRTADGKAGSTKVYIR